MGRLRTERRADHGPGYGAAITNFLDGCGGRRAGGPDEVDQAFFVKCDRTTMTQDDIDNGRLIVVVGVAPVKPAEFVIVRISQKTIETPQ